MQGRLAWFDGKGECPDKYPRYAQAETSHNYTHLSYVLIHTHIQVSHDESKEIEQVSLFKLMIMESAFIR
jgi:hypothetical protein